MEHLLVTLKNKEDLELLMALLQRMRIKAEPVPPMLLMKPKARKESVAKNPSELPEYPF